MSEDHDLSPEHRARTAAFRGLLRRREALAALGAGVGSFYGIKALAGSDTDAAAAACLLQRESTDGPFYLDLDLTRRDITEGRGGTPLSLRFQVVDASSCKPIRNAAVEVWHCDAQGIYSGVDGDTGTFMRGVQRASTRGRAQFESIVPGWYPGRTPHIHVKVFAGGSNIHTGQVYFRPAVLRTIYAQGVYRTRGQADTSNAGDGLYGQSGARSLLAMKRKGASVGDGYTGSIVLGVER